MRRVLRGEKELESRPVCRQNRHMQSGVPYTTPRLCSSVRGGTTMPIKVLELHHHGIRIGKSADDVSKAQEFYTDLLGLQADAGRPNIPGIPGFWLYVGNDQNTAQIHLMGAEGRSPVARS